MTARILKFPMERVRPPELNTPAEQAALKSGAKGRHFVVSKSGVVFCVSQQADWRYQFCADFVRPEPPGAA